MNDNLQILQTLSRKVGRPSNLAIFRENCLLAAEIQSLPFSAQNDSEWFVRYSGYMIRRFRDGRDSTNFKLLPAMELHICHQIGKLRETPARKFFKESLRFSGQWFPDLRLAGVRRKRAIQLSRALLRLTQRDPYLVRDVALGYCLAVSARMQVTITDDRDAEFGTCSWALSTFLIFHGSPGGRQVRAIVALR